MQCIHSISALIPPSIKPSENDSCYVRTAKMALPVFLSLAGFALMPSWAAIGLSASVTLGTIVIYNGFTITVIEERNLPRPLDPNRKENLAALRTRLHVNPEEKYIGPPAQPWRPLYCARLGFVNLDVK